MKKEDVIMLIVVIYLIIGSALSGYLNGKEHKEFMKYQYRTMKTIILWPFVIPRNLFDR